MTHYVLMTPDCRVVCVDRQGKFCEHHAPGGVTFSGSPAIEAFVAGKVRLVYATQRGTSWFLYIEDYNIDPQAPSRGRVWYHPATARWDVLPPVTGLQRESRTLDQHVLHYKGNYLTPEGIDALTFEAVQSANASILRFLSIEHFGLFTELATAQWACGPEGRLARIDMISSMAEAIRLGNVTIPIEILLRAAEEAAQNPEITGELLFNQDWKIWRFVRYNPLIVLEAFGPEALEELAVQLSTLFRFGRYGGENKGDILVLTDCDAEKCQKIIDFALPEQPHKDNRIRVIVVSGEGEMAAFQARRDLLEEGEILSPYAPVLFCSTGVIFDNDVGGLLRKASLARQIVSVGLYHSAAASHSVTPSLEEESPLEAGEGKELTESPILLPDAGGRLMLVPNMGAMCSEAAKGCFEGFERYRHSYGEAALGAEPQAVVNFILNRINFLTTSIMDRVVRLATKDKVDPYNATGLICFAREKGRYKEMGRYLGELSMLREDIW